MRLRRAAAGMATAAALSASIVLVPDGAAQARPRAEDCSTARAQTATAWLMYQTYTALVVLDMQYHRNTFADANNAYHWHGVWEADVEVSQSC